MKMRFNGKKAEMDLLIKILLWAAVFAMAVYFLTKMLMQG